MTYEDLLGFLQSENPHNVNKALQHIKTSISKGDGIADELLILMLKSKTAGADDLALRYIIDNNQKNVVSKLRVPAHIHKNDLFNHALYDLWKYARKHEFDTLKKDAIERFLYIVCKRYIIRNSGNDDSNVDEFPELADYVLFSMTKKEKSLLLEIFDGLGTGCKEILKLRYFEELRYKAIAEKTNYTAQSAKVKSFNCISKLKASVKVNPELGKFIRNLLRNDDKINLHS